jgi:hypothetical protein
MEKTKILRKTKFEVKPFRSVRIGDPYYFEEMENGSSNKYLKDITCDFPKIPFSNRFAGVVLTESETEWEENSLSGKYRSYEVMFYMAKKDEIGNRIIQTELDDRYFPSMLKKEYHLGCDTAQFDICIDGKFENFQTGGDGWYGYCHHYRNNNAHVFAFSLDDDMTSYEEMTEYIRHTFHVVKETQEDAKLAI